MKYLACWNLPLAQYTPEVIYALGSALKWRKYRTASDYIYLSRATAERQGAHTSASANRTLKDVIRSCKRGVGPSNHCEGLIFESLPDLPADLHAWADGGPWRPRSTLILGSWWMLREIEFSNAEARSVTVNSKLRRINWTLPASKADPSALGESITHGCCCSWDGAARLDAPLCIYHLMVDHLRACRRRFPNRFKDDGRAKPGWPLFPDDEGEV